jgi:hypothetical protein
MWDMCEGVSRCLALQQLGGVKGCGLRGESDCCADAAWAGGFGEVVGVCAGAGGAAEGVLLLVGEAVVAEVFLLALFDAETGVADEHAETLVLGIKGLVYCSWVYVLLEMR